MIYIHNNPDNIVILENAIFGEDFIEHKGGRMNGVKFENLLLTDDSDGAEIAEAQWAGIRLKRNTLLALSDIHVLYDFPQSPEQENRWIVYRQELRDVTEQELSNFTWPTPPY
jgi:hypothetical protein